MRKIATTPGAVVTQTSGVRRTATVPALVGLIGATVSLPLSAFGLPLFFVAASLPLSALGVALGIRQRNEAAMLFGTAGMAFAAMGIALA